MPPLGDECRRRAGWYGPTVRGFRGPDHEYFTNFVKMGALL
jgi:hypothetical protein